MSFLLHAKHCRYGADLRRCSICRGLDADASAESYRRTANSETPTRG